MLFCRHDDGIPSDPAPLDSEGRVGALKHVRHLDAGCRILSKALAGAVK